MRGWIARCTGVLWLAQACGGAGVASKATTPAVTGGAIASAGPQLERVAPPPPAERSPELAIMRAELERAMTALARTKDGAPYFAAYRLTDRDRVYVTASFGAVVSSVRHRDRTLDVDVRAGSYALDSTHAVRGGSLSGYGGFPQLRPDAPLADGPDALRAALWLATDAAYKSALERLAQIKAERVVRAREEDRSDDFSKEARTERIEAPATLELDQEAWEDQLRRISAIFKGYPEIYESTLTLTADAVTRYMVTSEGSTVQVPASHVRLMVQAETTAEDGMELSLHKDFSAFSTNGLPDAARIEEAVRHLADDLMALRTAPVADPYVGPAILEGESASVFFHEVFGHRVEGHRQKDESEGQTFAKKIGQRVMPTFISVYDDPMARRLGTTDLMGHYTVDDESVLAQRADLVTDGVFRTFLMSRAPTRGVNRSNGHGRSQEGDDVVARQGNLIVQPSEVVASTELERRLIAEVVKAKKPYGLVFRRVSGGYTHTTRSGPQAFKVLPLLVDRVYPDGRRELIRGVDLEGTPLTVLSKIVAADDAYAVFNGVCGAESGWIPVSAASPSLLVTQIEVARREKGQDKPPVLPAPPLTSPAPAAPRAEEAR